MMTIAEVPEYIRRAEKLLAAEERQDIVSSASGVGAWTSGLVFRLLPPLAVG